MHESSNAGAAACRILHRTIQQGSHDSIDDARATMELALLKIKNGPLWDRGGARSAGEPLPAALAQRGHRCCLVDRSAVVRQYLAGDSSGVAVQDDFEAVCATVTPCCIRVRAL